MQFQVRVQPQDEGTRLQVVGDLCAEFVPDLEEQCAAAERPLVLDLSELVRADPAGLASLTRMVSADATLTGVSPFISLLLDRHKAHGRNPGEPGPE